MALDTSKLFEVEKGVSIEGTLGFMVAGRSLVEFSPAGSQKVTYLGGGDIDYIEFFDSLTQTTPNRIAKCTVTYTSDDPTSETWRIYDSDGSTVIETQVYSYTYTSDDLTKMEQVIT